jgi:hypothetical protein
MTLTREFVFTYLSDALTPAFAADGYRWLAPKNQFRADTPAGFRNLILAVSPYDDLVMVEWHLGLRIDAIEDVVKRFTRTLPGFYPDAHSVLISQGKLQGTPYLRHQVSDTEALDQVAKALLVFWEEIGQPFLMAHDSLHGVDALLNQAPTQPCPYLPNQAHRYLKGLVAARLAQRDDFEALAAAYATGLRQTATGDLLIDGYQRLLGYLRQLSLN